MSNETSKSTVSLKICKNYNIIQKKIMEIIEDLHAGHIFKQKKVLLKVSLMLADSPEKAINTHPEFIRGAIKAVRKLGGEPFIGESSGVYGFTSEAFRIAGIQRVASEEKVKLFNFDASSLVRESINGEVIKELYLPRILKDMDIFVSLPKLKTHRLLLYTGALKNQVGLIPGCQKVKIHLLADDLERLAQAIIDLNLHLKFNLALIDGIVGMEGNGPTSGNPIASNFLGGSQDLVALDAVCCDIIGITPESVLTNIIAEQRGLGVADLNKIDIRGDFRKVRRMSFAVPGSKYDLAKNKIYNRIYFSLRANIISPWPVKELCQRCGQCSGICPRGAIQRGQLTKKRKKCIKCFGCYENCPHRAIKLKCKWFLKPLFKKKLKNFGLDDLI